MTAVNNCFEIGTKVPPEGHQQDFVRTSSNQWSNGSSAKVFIPTRRKTKQPVHRTLTAVQICQNDGVKTLSGCGEHIAEDNNVNGLTRIPQTSVVAGHGRVADGTKSADNSELNVGDVDVSRVRDGSKASEAKSKTERPELKSSRSSSKKTKTKKKTGHTAARDSGKHPVAKRRKRQSLSEMEKSSELIQSDKMSKNETVESPSCSVRSRSSLNEPVKSSGEKSGVDADIVEESPSQDVRGDSVSGCEPDDTRRSLPSKAGRGKSLGKLTPEEIDILNMFDEVELSDQSHSNITTPKGSPPLARCSPTKPGDNVVIGCVRIVNATSAEMESRKAKKRKVQSWIRNADDDDLPCDVNDKQISEKEPADRLKGKKRHLGKSVGKRRSKKVAGTPKKRVRTEEKEQQEKRSKKDQDVYSIGRVMTRTRSKGVRMSTDKDDKKRDGAEMKTKNDHVSDTAKSRDGPRAPELRTNSRNGRTRLSHDRNTKLCNPGKDRRSGNSNEEDAEMVDHKVKGANPRNSCFDSSKKYTCEYCSYTAQSSSHIMVHTRTHTGERPFKCKVCKKGFIQQSALRVHLRIHSNMRPYSCGFCKSAFRTSGHLSDHLRIHTGERPYMCITCRKTFRISSHLQAHIRIHNNDRAYKCKVCNKAFIQSSQLKIHEKTHNRQVEAIYGCDLCKKKFLVPWNLQLHMRAVHSQGHKPFKCDKCEKAFTIKAYLARHKKSVHGSLKFSLSSCPVCSKQLSKFSMRRHMLTHATEKKYVCKMCSKGFNFSHSLLVHLRVHTENISCHCPICDVVFDDLAGMRQHMKKQHRVDPWDKKFWCTTCNRCFFNKGMLSRHRREVHTAQRLYACDICGKAFKNERNLRQHMKGHDKNTFIQCEFCDKCFSQRGNLKIHVRTVHNKIKDFTCSLCAAKFATKRNLLQHVRTHTGEKPFKCQYCPKQFTQGSSLNRHEMTHTGERPFKCEKCQKSFVQKIHLVGHMKTHRTEKCPFCDKSIPLRANFATHLTDHLQHGRYVCPPCNKGFDDRELFVEHCKNVCKVDGVVTSLIVKTLARQEKRDSPKAPLARNERLRNKQPVASRKRRSARKDRVALGLEPLDLSVDQNSNKLGTDQKPLTHTYAITDSNKQIVLQQL
ncbi:hypothetical protein LSH36_829g00020 [Paralvinella palmiformis]|uniref:C2H2-type domain-containing protein n=1 Tax=Paralvinella palmiformis TaxID=53620 RepID=A0AAD9IZ56_9ANNE|nr:hypothetical protein LSH36_829g00020 [Paralvinella palmiformis]